MSFTFTQDLKLQKRCYDAAQEYLSLMWPGLEDLEKKHAILNACAAGFLHGYRAAEEEKKGDECKLQPEPGSNVLRT